MPSLLDHLRELGCEQVARNVRLGETLARPRRPFRIGSDDDGAYVELLLPPLVVRFELRPGFTWPARAVLLGEVYPAIKAEDVARCRWRYTEQGRVQRAAGRRP